jgi:hypothetical protein
VDPVLVALIRDIGFPIALVIWFLTRLEPRLERLTRVLDRQREGLRELRRAQLLYVIGHPAFSSETKVIAQRMLAEQATVEDPTDSDQ